MRIDEIIVIEAYTEDVLVCPVLKGLGYANEGGPCGCITFRCCWPVFICHVFKVSVVVGICVWLFGKYSGEEVRLGGGLVEYCCPDSISILLWTSSGSSKYTSLLKGTPLGNVVCNIRVPSGDLDVWMINSRSVRVGNVEEPLVLRLKPLFSLDQAVDMWFSILMVFGAGSNVSDSVIL